VGECGSFALVIGGRRDCRCGLRRCVPVDCLIAATALTHNAPLVTKDDRIRNSGVVETIW
jgi:predicted nucleic acid-binding protein